MRGSVWLDLIPGETPPMFDCWHLLAGLGAVVRFPCLVAVDDLANCGLDLCLLYTLRHSHPYWGSSLSRMMSSLIHRM